MHSKFDSDEEIMVEAPVSISSPSRPLAGFLGAASEEEQSDKERLDQEEAKKEEEASEKLSMMM